MRISGRFARKMAENDENTAIWHRLKPFIYLGLKRKNPTIGRVRSEVWGYQELLVMPASLEHGRGEFRSYRNSQDRLDETTTGGDQVPHD
jgi:hypothetical protein